MTIESLLITQTVLIIVLLLKDYLLSFAKEKGKNLATKQDIYNITTKIEDAKSFYSERLETIRTSLQINAYEQNKIVENSLETLLTFYDVSVTLFNDNFSRNFWDMNIKDYESTFLEFQNQTESLFVKQRILYFKLLIFFGKDSEMTGKAAYLVDRTLDVKKIFSKHFGDIKIALVKEIKSLQSGNQDLYKQAVNESNKVSKAYHEEAKPVINSLQLALQEFIDTSIAYLRRKNLLQ